MTPIVNSDWKTVVVFAADGPKPQILLENSSLKVVIVGLEAGQRVPTHPESLAVYHFLEGSGWMIVDDERIPVAAGTTIITPAGAKRGVEAGTRLAFIANRIAAEG